jgi:hypothetical protein
MIDYIAKDEKVIFFECVVASFYLLGSLLPSIEHVGTVTGEMEIVALFATSKHTVGGAVAEPAALVALETALSRMVLATTVAILRAILDVMPTVSTVVALHVFLKGRTGVGIVAVSVAALFSVLATVLTLPETALSDTTRLLYRRITVQKLTLITVLATLLRLPESTDLHSRFAFRLCSLLVVVLLLLRFALDLDVNKSALVTVAAATFGIEVTAGLHTVRLLFFFNFLFLAQAFLFLTQDFFFFRVRIDIHREDSVDFFH